MSKGGIAVLVVAALVFATLGFVFGQVIQAAVDTGSADNPVVTEDFVETYVGTRLADMQTKINDLEEQVLALSGGSTGDNLDVSAIPEPGSGTITTPEEPSTATSSFTKVTVQADSVNVRSDASAEAEIVGNVIAETELDYLGQKNDSDGQVWYKVRLADDTEGWVASWLCYEPQ